MRNATLDPQGSGLMLVGQVHFPAEEYADSIEEIVSDYLNAIPSECEMIVRTEHDGSTTILFQRRGGPIGRKL